MRTKPEVERSVEDERKVAEARLEAADAHARYRAATGEGDTMGYWIDRMEALLAVVGLQAEENARLVQEISLSIQAQRDG